MAASWFAVWRSRENAHQTIAKNVSIAMIVDNALS
jgi:hypothetical protein